MLALPEKFTTSKNTTLELSEQGNTTLENI